MFQNIKSVLLLAFLVFFYFLPNTVYASHIPKCTSETRGTELARDKTSAHDCPTETACYDEDKENVSPEVASITGPTGISISCHGVKSDPGTCETKGNGDSGTVTVTKDSCNHAQGFVPGYTSIISGCKCVPKGTSGFQQGTISEKELELSKPPTCTPERQAAKECSSGGGVSCNLENGEPLKTKKLTMARTGELTECKKTDKITLLKDVADSSQCPVETFCYKSFEAGDRSGFGCYQSGEQLTQYFNQRDIEVPAKSAGVLTAVGCVPTEPQALVNGLIRYGSLGAGAVALLMMIWASFRYITSLGSSEAINQARDQFFAALIGLLFIILSVLLLQIIGYDILGIPGFGKA
jgi:hypothetical protein